jgi:hypothetical protein
MWSCQAKILTITLLTSVLCIGYPSCRCPQFYLITGIADIVYVDRSGFLVPGAVTTADTLYLWVTPDFTAYTDAGWHVEGTMPEADAFSSCSHIQVANHLTTFTVTSSQTFNQIPAGESLNTLLWSVDTQERVDTFGPVFPFMHGNPLRFLFLEKPVLPDHILTIHVRDNAGNTFTATAPPLIWQ